MKKSTTKTKASNKQKSNVVPINQDNHHTMVSEAAYYLAEKRGFSGGSPMQDWFEAEKHIELQINGNL
jgi:hypothetical protein